MNPLLTKERFGLYLLAWVPLGGILAYLLSAGGHLKWTEAAVFVWPLCVVYAFICLSAWYYVKSASLETLSVWRLALTHVLAAATVSFFWVQLARLLAYLLSGADFYPNLSNRLSPQLPIIFVTGVLFYLLAVALQYVILSLENSREAQARAMQTSVLARDAELKALKAQVNPHFLFNSLNSISALTSIDPARAREMCILLADFLRMTLGLGEKASITVEEELSLLERYLAIEKVRFGSRLNMEENIADDCRKLMIPALLLQPLVENAIVHGIANLTSGGTVRLQSRCENGSLLFTVENSFDPEATSTRRGGLGLVNVKRRLEARYGAAASVHAIPEAENFRVEVKLPAEAAEGQS